jgi:hypothetical protein
MTGRGVSSWELDDAEVMALSRVVRGWADRAFVAYPPIRRGTILDWAQELVDLRDEIDHVILWRAVCRLRDSRPERGQPSLTSFDESLFHAAGEGYFFPVFFISFGAMRNVMLTASPTMSPK